MVECGVMDANFSSHAIPNFHLGGIIGNYGIMQHEILLYMKFKCHLIIHKRLLKFMQLQRF